MNDSTPAAPRRRWLRASLGRGIAGMSIAGMGIVGMGAPAPAAAAPANAGPPALHWRERALLGFGTTLSLRAAHTDPQRLERALDDAVAEIRAIERQMNLFDPDSALTRLNTNGVLHRPDARLLEVLALARRVAERSDGAFDVTMQPLWQAWSHARRQERLATAGELALARSRVDWRMLDSGADAIRLRAPGMAVSLNGIAQGYAADRARAALQRHGVAHALLDTGEWAPLGRSDDARQPWRLGIADPHRPDALIGSLATDGRCVASSSDDRTVFSADHRHHHIVDPREGHSPALLSAVTVIASSGALADALTKVFFMAETALTPAQRHTAATQPEAARRPVSAPKFDAALARAALAVTRRWNVDALLVDKHGATWASPGFRLNPA